MLCGMRSLLVGGLAQAMALTIPLSIAQADPNPNATRVMGTAFSTCKKAMDRGTADERDERDYTSYRDRAFQRDPSIKTWTGLIEGMKTDETIRRCDAFFAKQASATPSPEAQKLMHQAFSLCMTLLSPSGQNRIEKFKEDQQRYQEARNGALKADPKIKDWTGKLWGREVKSRLAECDEKIPKVLADWEAQIGKSKEVQEQRRLQSKKEDEERKKKFQALVQSLKGDRRRILAEHGHEPSDWKGKLATAPEWKYKSYPSDRGPHWHCTITYTFRGNKLTGKRRRGPYCD